MHVRADTKKYPAHRRQTRLDTLEEIERQVAGSQQGSYQRTNPPAVPEGQPTYAPLNEHGVVAICQSQGRFYPGGVPRWTGKTISAKAYHVGEASRRACDDADGDTPLLEEGPTLESLAMHRS